MQATAHVSCEIRNVLTEGEGQSDDHKDKGENSLHNDVMTNTYCVEKQRPTMATGVESGIHGGSGSDVREAITSSARPSSAAASIWMRHPIYSRLLTDEEIITQALYAVMTPLISNREEEWRRVFESIFNIEEIQDHKRSLDISEIEWSVREVLIERGYGDDEDTVTAENLHNLKGSRPDVNTTDVDIAQENEIISNTSNEEENAKSEGTDHYRLRGPATEKTSTQKGLSSYGMSLLMAALHMYSLLTIHHCCCITAPSGAGKSTVWKVILLGFLFCILYRITL